ncbi:hypothetical protein SPOG_03348 [Schizosaccharomyces cryophilus OY26]|uniref:Uncharacterized protein n=1 Tax=Schizosaccharomyces cryophilus (strain OY26 / ATCC MYA-4695 / CBS 11777 / NBRC 106824 / NRRL Y48691) TaxID=653667 RepID=S9WYW2_SCHCR|nr:uncharacterized protein SPOG_03348 [Schizosaccharomyces cryophilus OY26]EPY49877.1 hypothetical protein SPOG_03348 [Schizosaccharomyces cryophilus OY26]
MSLIASPIMYHSPVGYAYKLYLEGNLASSLHVLENYLQEDFSKEGNINSACNLYLRVSSELGHSWQKTQQRLKLVYEGAVPRSLLNELVITYCFNKTWESSEQVAEFLSLAEQSKSELFSDDRRYPIEKQLVVLACEWKLFPLAKSLLTVPYQKKEQDLFNYISEQELQHEVNRNLLAETQPNIDATKKSNFLIKFIKNLTRIYSQIMQKVGFFKKDSTWFSGNSKFVFVAFTFIVLLFKLKAIIRRIRRSHISWEGFQSFLEKFAFFIS